MTKVNSFWLPAVLRIGSRIRCPFDPWTPVKFLGKKVYNFLKTGQHFKNKIIFYFVKFVATKKGMTKNLFRPSLLLLFLNLGSGVREIRDPEWVKIRIRDPGYKSRIRNTGYRQGFGSGSVLDPYSIGPVDPDPYSESGSGSRRAKMTHKRRKNSCFEVLDGLFCELQASSITWTYFTEA